METYQIVLIVALLLAGGVFVYSKKKSKPAPVVVQPPQVIPKPPVVKPKQAKAKKAALDNKAVK